MERKRLLATLSVAALGLLLAGADYAFAHCDGVDGPVVTAARKALATNNVNFALIWVQKQDEPELRGVFQQTVAVRRLSPEGRALADQHFFETIVRLHRQGEGAPYTGLKPAGRDLGPAIPAADRAVESGKTSEIEALLVRDVRNGLRTAYDELRSRSHYDPNDVTAGRAYVKAYVEYIHFVERLHESATNAAAGHYAEAESH